MRRVRSCTGVLPRVLVVFALTGLGLGAVDSPAGVGAPRNDHLLVLRHRAGPFHFVDSFQKGKPYAYPAAVAAFGSPSDLRVEFLDERTVYQPETAGFCFVTWPGAGVRLKLFSYSGSWPPEEDAPAAPRLQPCSRPALARADLIELTLFGAGWHNTAGLRVGAPRPARSAVRIRIPSTRFGAYDELLALGTAVDPGGLVTSIRVTVLGAP